jgi:Tol biopolymer transport system component
MLPLLLGATLLAQALDTVTPRLRYVATVRQYGPVGYRDPLGAISPDGAWLATASETRVRLGRIGGGAMTQLGSSDEQITDLAWLPESRHLAVRSRTFDHSRARWVLYDVRSGASTPLWPERAVIRGMRENDTIVVHVDPADLIQLTWSPSGDSVAGIARGPEGSALWVVRADGGGARVRARTWRLSFPAWRAGGQGIACLSLQGRRQRLDFDCGTAAADSLEAYGPIAFTAQRHTVYYASPNSLGTLDLRRRVLGGGSDQRMTAFTRDAYAPSISRDGRVLFKTQDYRVFIADAPAEGGASRPLTTFQSETPTWSPDGRWIGVTFGTWRRVIDDLHYPDIAQDLGIIPVQDTPVAAPATVFRASPSEDQGMAWSPNGRWIAFHSHADGTDDVYLQPADRSSPPRLVSEHLYETGWARWSPDGRWIVFPSEEPSGGASHGLLSVVGVDPETGQITTPRQRVRLDGFAGGVLQAEWSSDSRQLVFDGITALGHKGLYVVARGGGRPRRIHQYLSDQVTSGISASPDFRWIAFVAPGPDGHFQVYRVPVTGGVAQQLTFDPTDKTQPAYAPDGRRIAFTVFGYEVQFWLLTL